MDPSLRHALYCGEAASNALMLRAYLTSKDLKAVVAKDDDDEYVVLTNWTGPGSVQFVSTTYSSSSSFATTALRSFDVR